MASVVFLFDALQKRRGFVIDCDHHAIHFMMCCHNRLLNSTSGHMAECSIKHQDVRTVGCLQRAARLPVGTAHMLHDNNTAGHKPPCPLTVIMVHMTVKLREA